MALTGALMALGLASCASVPETGRNWAFTPASRDEPAKLVFGHPNSDDVDLVLWCDAARREVLFTPVGAEDERFGRLTLSSGGAALDLNLSQDPRFGSVGAVGLDSPLLSAFRDSGRLLMVLDSRLRLHLNASAPQGRRRIQAFFQACR